VLELRLQLTRWHHVLLRLFLAVCEGVSGGSSPTSVCFAAPWLQGQQLQCGGLVLGICWLCPVWCMSILAQGHRGHTCSFLGWKVEGGRKLMALGTLCCAVGALDYTPGLLPECSSAPSSLVSAHLRVAVCCLTICASLGRTAHVLYACIQY
jgi:hypothetical protein